MYLAREGVRKKKTKFTTQIIRTQTLPGGKTGQRQPVKLRKGN